MWINLLIYRSEIRSTPVLNTRDLYLRSIKEIKVNYCISYSFVTEIKKLIVFFYFSISILLNYA